MLTLACVQRGCSVCTSSHWHAYRLPSCLWLVVLFQTQWLIHTRANGISSNGWSQRSLFFHLSHIPQSRHSDRLNKYEKRNFYTCYLQLHMVFYWWWQRKLSNMVQKFGLRSGDVVTIFNQATFISYILWMKTLSSRRRNPSPVFISKFKSKFYWSHTHTQHDMQWNVYTAATDLKN